jgi:hypothetical protein
VRVVLQRPLFSNKSSLSSFEELDDLGKVRTRFGGALKATTPYISHYPIHLRNLFVIDFVHRHLGRHLHGGQSGIRQITCVDLHRRYGKSPSCRQEGESKLAHQIDQEHEMKAVPSVLTE